MHLNTLRIHIAIAMLGSSEIFVCLMALWLIMWLIARAPERRYEDDVIRGLCYAIIPSVIMWLGIIWILCQCLRLLWLY